MTIHKAQSEASAVCSLTILSCSFTTSMPAFVSGCIKCYKMLLCRMTADRKGLEIFFHLKDKLLPPKSLKTTLEPHFQEAPSAKAYSVGPKNPRDGFSAVAKYKIFVPDLLELYTQFPWQKLWAKALNTSTLTTTVLRHRDLPSPQGSQPTGMCAPGEDRSEGGFSYLCYTCVAGKPAAGCDALNSGLFHTGWNPAIHCCIWEMKGLTKVVTLPKQFYFLTAICVRAPQVRAELLSKTRNFFWLLTAHVWGQKCDFRDRGHFPLLRIS